MKNEALLIDEQSIKLRLPISESLDFTFLSPHITTAQDKYLQPILGTQLLQKLYDLIAADGIRGTVYENLITDYISKTLAHWTLYEAFPFLPIKIINSTIVRAGLIDDEGISLDESMSLRQVSKATAEFYSERLYEYLENNKSTFPEYSEALPEDVTGGSEKKRSFGLNLEK